MNSEPIQQQFNPWAGQPSVTFAEQALSVPAYLAAALTVPYLVYAQQTSDNRIPTRQ